MPVRVSGQACKAGRAFDRWYGQAVIGRGAWASWLRSKDWAGFGKVVLNLDHAEQVLEWLASTADDTLAFDTREIGSEQWLAYAADIDDANPTTAQTDIVALLRQGKTPDVSLGYLILDFDWELAADPDNERTVDTMMQKKIAPWQLSVVGWGAQKEDGNIALTEAAAGAMAAETTGTRLGCGPMRGYLHTPGGETAAENSPEGVAVIAASKAAAEDRLAARLRPPLIVTPETVTLRHQEATA